MGRCYQYFILQTCILQQRVDTKGSLLCGVCFALSGLKVSIDIQYSPLGESLEPTQYKASTAVSLRCVAEGASGTIRYQWSSTCANCFVSGTSQTVSTNRLRSYDAGQHTCIAMDDSRNFGNANTTMQIIG